MMEAVAYLKGVLADGHVYERNQSIRIVVRQNDKEWLLKSIAPILCELTMREPKIIQTKDGVYSLWVYTNKTQLSDEIVTVLLKPFGEIDFENNNEKLSFIRGFFEVEGSIYINSKKKNDVRIIMYQKYPEVLQTISTYLEFFGIHSKIYGPYNNGKNLIYRLIIFSKQNSMKFLDVVNPNENSKFTLKLNALRGRCT
jgi:intein/homing endonuclease